VLAVTKYTPVYTMIHNHQRNVSNAYNGNN